MIQPIFFNPFYKPNDTILVVGSGRSGTTWLGNIIGSCLGFLSLFEPFDYRHVPQINTSLLRLYIRANEKSHYLDNIIRDILLGKLTNEWVLSQNARRIAWRILLKEIRANLFLGYIQNKFQNPIVFIVRHPCATVLSRAEKGWETHLDDFLKQEQLMEDYLAPFEDIIKSAQSALEKHAIMWSIENLVPLTQLRKDTIIFCTYENLVLKTKNELNRIFNMLGLKVSSKIDRIISKPTNVTSKSASSFAQKSHLEYWQNKLDKYEIQTILNIAHSFEIDMYDENTMPNLNCSFLKKPVEGVI